MKKRNIRLKYNILTCLFLASFYSLQAATYSHNETLKKTYKINRETAIYINNKYGKVHISNWNKDSVMIEINLTIKSSNYTRVYKLKDNIDFDFVKTKYSVNATTIFGSRYSSIFSDLKGIAESLVSTDNQVTIDYTILAPLWVNLKIENKFGDVFIDDADGEISINVSNGDLKANKLMGASFLTLNSGGADIYQVEDCKIIANYTNINVRNAKKLDITSKACTVNLNDIDYLKVNSKRDKYFVSSVRRTLGDTYFSDINISQLNDEISYDMKYGNLNLEHVSESFSFVNIISEYADVDILFDRDITYNFDMTHFNTISFYYPKSISNLQEKLVDEETKEYMVYGTIGQGETTGAKVNIKAYKKCYIRIEHK